MSGEGGKRVVVIGGGVAGAFVAKSLQFGSDLTLIDPKEYFEIPWASLRATVEPSFAERSVIHHKDYLTNGWLVTSRAIDIDDRHVLTANGRSIPYDYLVIATGHDDQITETRAQRLEQYQSEHEKIQSSQSILIVGGGPTGVELAAEIAVDFPEKKVTLVHEGSRLVEFVGPKASDKTLHWLTTRRVEVKLNCQVDLSRIANGRKQYATTAGEIIKADCHFLCIGKPLASKWLMETILRDNLDEYGRLKVDLNMRIKGHKNIFAAGDITNVKEMKQGYYAQKHAAVIAKNINLLMKGGMEQKLETYEPKRKKSTVIVSLGRQDAMAQFPYATVIGLVPGLIKSKDLFVGKTRKQLGIHY